MAVKSSELKVNQPILITDILGSESIRLRLMEAGFTPDTEITLTSRLPFGGPLTFRCHGTKIAIRAEDAQFILGQYAYN